MRSRPAFAAIGVSSFSLFVLACSSGTSGGGSAVNLPADIGGSQVTCAGSSSETTTPQACVDCQVRSCKVQAQAVFGTDPKKFGGSCGAFYACLCACPESDPQCAFGCFSKADQACQAAGKALDDCIEANCRNAAGTGVCPNDE